MSTTEQGVDERVAALHDKADEALPESWQPTTPGEELTGTFVRLDRGTTSYGPCWIVVLESIKNPGTYRSVWLFHTALKNQFNKARPKPGSLVLIKYEGKRTPKGGGTDYHDWKVLTESDGSGFSWDEFNVGDAGAAQDFAPDDAGTDASYVASDSDIPFIPTIDGLGN